jgi:hypothetical protein
VVSAVHHVVYVWWGPASMHLSKRCLSNRQSSAAKPRVTQRWYRISLVCNTEAVGRTAAGVCGTPFVAARPHRTHLSSSAWATVGDVAGAMEGLDAIAVRPKRARRGSSALPR